MLRGEAGPGRRSPPAPTTCPTSAPAHPRGFAQHSPGPGHMLRGRSCLCRPAHHSLKLWYQSLLTSHACLRTTGDAADTEELDLNLTEF